jgi:hypothetical protein
MTTECAANVARDINIYMIDLHRTTIEAPNAPEPNHEERQRCILSVFFSPCNESKLINV